MKTKLLFSVLVITALLPLVAEAEVWQDPKTLVNYEYTVGQSRACVKGGSYSAGSPDVTGDIAILPLFSVDGNDYVVTSIDNSAFYHCSGLTMVTIPSSVTSIGNSAFSCCTGLTSVNIPSNVASIGYEAFYDCSGLTSLTIPSSLTSIGHHAFSGCGSLVSIYVENGNPIYDSRYNCNAIIETSSNTLIKGCNNTVIPSSVTSIGDGAFHSCSGLTSVTIPSSVTSIGDYAFHSCRSLTSVDIPKGVTKIGESTFYECVSLPSVVIPEGVTEIGGLAFGKCNGLTSVTIPSSVTSIGGMAFYNCSALKSVTSLIDEPFKVDENVFRYYGTWEDYFTSATLYVPKGTKEKYKVIYAWNLFQNIVELDKEINDVDAIVIDGEPTVTERYALGGQRVSSQQRGLNIVRMSDGTVRKVLVR